MLAAVLRAWRRARSPLGRLIWTSRFDFEVRGQRLATLERVALGGLQPDERVRLPAAAGVTAALRERCAELGRGNPGLTTQLLQLASDGDRAEVVDQVLEQLEARALSALPDAEVAGFFERVRLDALVGLLKASERALAEASAVLEVPVPLEAATALQASWRSRGRRWRRTGCWRWASGSGHRRPRSRLGRLPHLRPRRCRARHSPRRRPA